MSRQALGRGFDSLIPKEVDKSIIEDDKHRVQKLAIDNVKPNPDQPRRQIGEDSLNELAQSIKRHGVLQPIIVVKKGDDYQIVAGERRWRAAKAAGLNEMPAIVRSLQELEQVELALIENIQRVDLSPLEQALAVYKLQQQFNLKLEEIAAKLGKAPSTISNLTRLLQLPDKAHLALREGKISEGHARAILALRQNPAKQLELLQNITDKKWTVRQAEQFANATKKGSAAEEAAGKTASETPLTKDLSQRLGTPVKIKHTAKGGQLVIFFKDEKDLEKISQQLQK